MNVHGKTLSLAASLSFLLTLASAPNAHAEETWINGKKYSLQHGKLYPMIKNDWTSLDGTVHEGWITDYTSWEAPKTKEMVFAPNRPIVVPPAKVPQTKNQGIRTSDPTSAIAVRDEGSKHYITIGADVLFEFDKDELNQKAEKVMLAVGPIIKKYGDCSVSIDGHTDAIGTDEYNQMLSKRRANTVKEWLSSRQLISGSVSTHGLGKRSPVAPNTHTDGTDDPEGRAKNRRVEIVVDTAVAEGAL